MELKGKFDFSAESRQDLVRYFEVLAKELDRVLEACEGKRESLDLLENFLRQGLKDNTALSKHFPTKAKV